MNIYDFDGTIYDGDSSRDMVKFGLKKYPFLTLKSLRKARKTRAAYKQGFATFEQVKEDMFSFIFQINNYPKFLNDFVDSHMSKIKALYKSRQTENDIIVSASFDLWVNLFARRLGVRNVICTKVDSNGKIIGANCKGSEKMRRIKEVLPNTPIENAFSDSQSDEYILEMANHGFVVEGNKVLPYVRGYKFKVK